MMEQCCVCTCRHTHACTICSSGVCLHEYLTFRLFVKENFKLTQVKPKRVKLRPQACRQQAMILTITELGRCLAQLLAHHLSHETCPRSSGPGFKSLSSACLQPIRLSDYNRTIKTLTYTQKNKAENVFKHQPLWLNIMDIDNALNINS